MPIGYAAVLEEVARSGTPSLRIKPPNFLSRFRIEGNHAIGRSGEVKRSINHDWRGFEWHNVMPARFIVFAVQLSHVIRPRPSQPSNVLAIDLFER